MLTGLFSQSDVVRNGTCGIVGRPCDIVNGRRSGTSSSFVVASVNGNTSTCSLQTLDFGAGLLIHIRGTIIISLGYCNFTLFIFVQFDFARYHMARSPCFVALTILSNSNGTCIIDFDTTNMIHTAVSSSKRGNLQETDTHGQDQDQRLQTFGRVLHDTFS